jgi:hypothetical protein
LCNAPETFQQAMLSIFSILIPNCVEVSIDDFTIFGDVFEEALTKLETLAQMISEYEPLPN